MALETGTFINDLVITNPPGTDLKSQGDDHLQLIKKVLKNTFPNATRPFPIPTVVPVSGSGSIISAQQNSLIVVGNAAAMTLTMPTLLTADAGWSVNVLKLPGSVGPLFIAPPSGTIMSGQVSVTKARRNIPGVQFQVLWTGSSWVCGRCTNSPVGSVVPFFTGALPVGFEWPNGQLLVATDYPEYVALRGGASTPDLRQRSFFGTNLGGGSVNLIDPARSGINPAVLESAGGFDTVTLITANLPPYTPAGSVTNTASGTSSYTPTGSNTAKATDPPVITANNSNNPGANPPVRGSDGVGGTFTVSVTGTYTFTGDAVTFNFGGSPQGGTSNPVNKMSPAIITNYALVVE